MILKSKKLALIAAATAGVLASPATTPAKAHGFHHRAYHVVGYGSRIRFGYGGGYGRGYARREIGRIYARGFGGCLRNDVPGCGVGLPYPYYNVPRHPYGYARFGYPVVYSPIYRDGIGDLFLGLRF